MDAVQIRLMVLEDIDSVCEMEIILFSAPWSRESFENELKKDYNLSYVAVDGEKVVGYIICWLVVDEVHIGNIAVHPDYQRRKIGELLVNKVLSHSNHFVWAGLEVRKSNKQARAFYLKLGFREIGVRKNYYTNNSEDAILMSKVLKPKNNHTK